jgi:hypothetical protein
MTPPDEAGNSLFAGNFTLTGGSGKFANAQGSGTLRGVINLSAGTLDVSLDGEMVPPAVPVSSGRSPAVSVEQRSGGDRCAS